MIWFPPAWAQSPGEAESEEAPTPKTIWMDRMGNGFRKDTYQVEGILGAGIGTRVFGTRLTHDLAMGAFHAGWVFTDVIAPDKWYRGNLELLVEVFGGAQFHPNGAYFVGLAPLLRYNLATGSRWVPFVNGGCGLSATNIDDGDISGTFQFNVQLGAGTHYFLTDRTALTIQYRWLHFSSAGIQEPNYGTNTQMFLIGASWFF